MSESNNHPNNNTDLKKRVKKAAVPTVIGVVLLSILTRVGVMFFNSISTESITAFESLNLQLRGMRITEEYELKANGKDTEISYYNMSYANGKEERVLIKRTVCETQTVIDSLNGFNVMGWDGFRGKHPKGVLDGTMFTLTATVNGGRVISANGSQNFPKHFNEFEQWLYELLKDCEEISEP